MPLQRAGRRNYSYARPAGGVVQILASFPIHQYNCFGLMGMIIEAAAESLGGGGVFTVTPQHTHTTHSSSPRCAFSKKSQRVRIAFRRPAPRGCNWIQRAALRVQCIHWSGKSDKVIYLCVRERERAKESERGKYMPKWRLDRIGLPRKWGAASLITMRKCLPCKHFFETGVACGVTKLLTSIYAH
jgi:hypothetical protein